MVVDDALLSSEDSIFVLVMILFGLGVGLVSLGSRPPPGRDRYIYTQNRTCQPYVSTLELQ
jgi:hypothetical protein